MSVRNNIRQIHHKKDIAKLQNQIRELRSFAFSITAVLMYVVTRQPWAEEDTPEEFVKTMTKIGEQINTMADWDE